ncbi:MAG: carbamoyltransferase HypF [Nitrospirae bacterium RBG_13_39_12]|nr:MAG: carbamoyltransferase HypF [Nitrospirae bacterium RBG_13_39_12]
MEQNRVRILVKGIVQGVGFRPFVYSLAKSLNLTGFVMNSSEGVVIEIEGKNTSNFIDRLKREAPPLSQIMGIDITIMQHQGYHDFRIIKSKDEGSFTLISSDVSTCKDCLSELFNMNDRRYLYPFINCTNCGPRYTITRSIPYDRPNTTMSLFKMCTECEKEYNNPGDRRFHAQPNACHVCGPHVQLIITNEKLKDYGKDNPIESTIELLKNGNIIAVKGLGGFHIACDATNEEAVKSLRFIKRKNNKPFALMAPDVETIKNFCEVSREDEVLLTSTKRPVVLLKKLRNNLTEAISPNNPCIGFMLPYTPLHYLLFYYPLTRTDTGIIEKPQEVTNFEALIMTSGNISEEPIVIDNNEAISRLSGIADAFLIHNRDIFMRVDDSVVRVIGNKVGADGQVKQYNSEEKPADITRNISLSFIRRSRGYVPDPIPLHEDGPEVLGCGSDIKNTFTLTKGSFAIPSQHIGDMENYETLEFFEESLKNLKDVYRVKPEAIAYDLHPGYLSTQWALRQEDTKKIGIQHHHAHIASVMAEKGIKDKVIGVSFDGTGYGTDGNLWGGEIMIADVFGFERLGHFKYIPLPGGETSVKEPWRIAVSYIKDLAGDDTIPYLKSIGFIDKYGNEKIKDVLKIVDKKQFSPLSSGAGRLFDAVSAIIGVCDKNTFEGESAIALESLTTPDVVDDYPVDIKSRKTIEIDFSQTILRIINDLLKGEGKDIISSKFHNTILSVIFRVVKKLSYVYLIKDVVLCGGVFQNMYLMERAIDLLKSAGMDVHIHEKIPCNDAGISLGQAYIIREMIKSGVAFGNKKLS